MAATRLSDSQKTELVSGFQAGESTQGLADRFGCSANTVIRVAKTALGVEAYEKLKRQRSRSGPTPDQANQLPLEAIASDPEGVEPAAGEADPSGGADRIPPAGGQFDSGTEADLDDAAAPDTADRGDPVSDSDDSADDSADLPVVDQRHDDFNLAVGISFAGVAKLDPAPELELGPDLDVVADLDAAVDLDDDPEYGDDDDLIGEDDIADDDLDNDSNDQDAQTSFLPIAVLGLGVDDHGSPATLQPLADAQLPASVYMLVDKTVELQARPLSDITELGLLPPEELDRRALVVFTNPRQAKRLCGRTQRVIKLPDTRVIERTAPYLLAQGISRVVVEGALYSLPGS